MQKLKLSSYGLKKTNNNANHETIETNLLINSQIKRKFVYFLDKYLEIHFIYDA